MTQEIVERDQGALPLAQAKPLTPSEQTIALLERLVSDPSVDLDRLERIIAMRDRQLAKEAEQAFVAAMSAFKANPPKILKDKLVSFQTDKGITEYRHARLGTVCDAICGALSSYGLSHNWKTDQLDGGLIAVTCTLRHVGGHSESVTLKAGRDDSGKKNNIQAVGSAITYLQRYTLLAITGLATHDMDDDDGAAGGDIGGEPGETGESSPYITRDEAQEIRRLISASGSDEKRFLAFVQAPSIEKITRPFFSKGIALLNQKLQAKEKKS